MGFINSVKGKILIGFILAIIVYVSFRGTTEAVGLSHYGTTVWLHVLAGIVWIGLLYYFNFVQVPAMGEALGDTDGPGPAAIGKYIAPRALLWFRMAAATTLLLGLVLLGTTGSIGSAYMLAPGYQVIGLGTWMGTIMAFNVWFIIWPNQKKIIAGELEGDALAKAKRMAFLASRTNAWLSIPMLIGMIAANHGGIMF